AGALPWCEMLPPGKQSEWAPEPFRRALREAGRNPAATPLNVGWRTDADAHTTRYFPVSSCRVGPLVFRLKVPISRAADGPRGLTSGLRSFGSVTSSQNRLAISGGRLGRVHAWLDHGLPEYWGYSATMVSNGPRSLAMTGRRFSRNCDPCRPP